MMFSLAVKPRLISSAAITPCMAALPALNDLVSLPRFFITPAMAEAAFPSAIRVCVTSRPINFAVKAATPNTGWNPWLNQPRHSSVLRAPSIQGFAVW